MIVSTDNNPQPDQQNVLLDVNSGPATTIFGMTNQTGTSVSFMSSTSLVAGPNGQASIQASSGVFNNLTISLTGGGSFTNLIFALSLAGSGASCTSCITFSGNALEPNGTAMTAPGGTFNLGPGMNFFTVTTAGGEKLTSFSLSATAPGLQAMTDARIGGVSAASAVPEPASVGLLAGGGVLLLLLKKRLA